MLEKLLNWLFGVNRHEVAEESVSVRDFPYPNSLPPETTDEEVEDRIVSMAMNTGRVITASRQQDGSVMFGEFSVTEIPEDE